MHLARDELLADPGLARDEHRRRGRGHALHEGERGRRERDHDELAVRRGLLVPGGGRREQARRSSTLSRGARRSGPGPAPRRARAGGPRSASPPPACTGRAIRAPPRARPVGAGGLPPERERGLGVGAEPVEVPPPAVQAREEGVADGDELGPADARADVAHPVEQVERAPVLPDLAVGAGEHAERGLRQRRERRRQLGRERHVLLRQVPEEALEDGDRRVRAPLDHVAVRDADVHLERERAIAERGGGLEGALEARARLGLGPAPARGEGARRGEHRLEPEVARLDRDLERLVEDRRREPLVEGEHPHVRAHRLGPGAVAAGEARPAPELHEGAERDRGGVPAARRQIGRRRGAHRVRDAVTLDEGAPVGLRRRGEHLAARRRVAEREPAGPATGPTSASSPPARRRRSSTCPGASTSAGPPAPTSPGARRSSPPTRGRRCGRRGPAT